MKPRQGFGLRIAERSRWDFDPQLESDADSRMYGTAVKSSALHDDEQSFNDVFQIVWKGRKWIFLATLAALLATYAYCLLAQKLYNASAEILVDPRELQVLTKDVNPSSVAPDGGVAQVESQVRVIQSSGVLSRAIAATHLESDPEFNGDSFLSRLLSRSDGAANASVKTLTNLKKRVTVKRADKVFVIELTVAAGTPEKSAQIANAIAEAYLEDQAAAKQRAGREAADALTARLSEQRQRVEDAENKVQQYKAAKKLISASGQLVSEQQLSDLNRDLEAARLRTGGLRARLDQMNETLRRGGAGDGTTEAMQSATISTLREQESALIQKQADLQSQLGPRHPAYIAVDMQISRVRQLISAELGRLSKSVKADYDRALAVERSLSNNLEHLKTDNLTSNQDMVHLRELEGELATSRSVYSAFMLRANEAREQAGIDTTNARIITRAVPPQDKSWPLTGILLAGAMATGLGLGTIGVMTREYIKPSVLTPRQAEQILDTVVIGTLPPVNPKAARDEAFDEAVWMAMHKLFDMDSAPATRGPVRSLMFTSSAFDTVDYQSCMRAFVKTLARAGERVVFVMADPTQKVGPATDGLMEVLRGTKTFRQVTNFESNGNFYQVGPGRLSGRMPARINRDFAQQLLLDARKHFDIMIIDAGDLRDNYLLAPLVEDVDHLVTLAKLKLTPQKELLGLNDAAVEMQGQVSGILLVESMGQS